MQADILVSSEGACAKVMIRAAGQAMQQVLSSPRAGQVTVTDGYNLGCSHVIHTRCCNYDGPGGTAEGVRILCLELVSDLSQNSAMFRFRSFCFFKSNYKKCFVCFGEAFAEFEKLLSFVATYSYK